MAFFCGYSHLRFMKLKRHSQAHVRKFCMKTLEINGLIPALKAELVYIWLVLLILLWPDPILQYVPVLLFCVTWLFHSFHSQKEIFESYLFMPEFFPSRHMYSKVNCVRDENDSNNMYEWAILACGTVHWATHVCATIDSCRVKYLLLIMEGMKW